MEWLTISANSGNADAMYCLSVLMLTPSSGIFDKSKGACYLDMAMSKEHQEACLYGIIMEIFDLQNPAEISYIIEFAHKFSTDALGIMTLRLGDTMMASTDVPDYTKMAFRLYSESVRCGNTEAMRKVGYMYEHAIGVENSFGKAADHYRMAADKGDPVASEMLEDLQSGLDSEFTIID